jgi:predicted PurR-regulated permease PerM
MSDQPVETHRFPKPALPPRRRALAGDTAVVLGIALLVAITLVLAWFARPIIVWVLAAGFLAFSLDPLVDWLGRKLHVGQGIRITVAFLLVALGIAATVFVFVPPIVKGAEALGDAIPTYIQRLKDSSASQSLGTSGELDALQSSLQNIPSLFDLAGELLSVAAPIVGGIFAGIMIIFLTVYFLVYGRSMRRGIAARLAPETGRRWLAVTKEIYETTKSYWYGKFLIAVIAGGTAYVAMRLLDVPYAAPLAFFIGITDLIPNIGATIGTIPAVLVAAFESWWQAIVLLAILVAYQQLENGVITPRVFAKATDLHPFTTFVVVLVFGALFGVVGALLAIPIAASVKIVVESIRGRRSATMAS